MRIAFILAALVLALPLATLTASVTHAANGNTVTLNLRDVEIGEAMAMLAKQERLNILLSDNVEGSLSLNLYDVPVADAVNAIADAAGYAVERRNGAYFVMEHDKVGLYSNGDITQVQRFNIHYADPASLEEMLEPYLSRYGKIQAMPERRMLLVSDKPEFLRRISLIVRHADARPRQVVIEARILEVVLDSGDSFGIDWARILDSDNRSGSFGTQGFAGGGSSGSNGFFFDFLNNDLSIALTALQREGRIRTLSTPKLVALDNQEAEVIIGDRRGYSVTTTINQVTSESIEFLESGVILRVTPHIDELGQVLMDVHPEVSRGTVDTAGIPSQTTTEVTTSLLVPSGETVFIGGLMRHADTQGYKRVPVLGRIPGLKRLFSSREMTRENVETIVLITPRVVEDFAADWNVEPRGTVEEALEELEIGAEELKEIMDAELEASREPLPFLSESTPETDPEVAPTAAPAAAPAAVPSSGVAAVAVAEADTAGSVLETWEVEQRAETLDLENLSGSLYTVQLMTMSSRERMEAYMAEHDVGDLPVAPLERDGEVYYALLLGIYDTFVEAEQAMTQLPPGLSDKTPWVRSLGSVQTAMRRADTVFQTGQELAAAQPPPASPL